MRILILRSAPIYMLKEAIAYLESQSCPRDEKLIFSVLTSEEAVPEIDKIGKSLEIIPYSKRKFSLRGLGLGLWYKLLKERFDLAVVLYANYFGEGYLNCELIPFSILARRKMAINSWGKVIEITYKDLLLRLFSPFFRWAWYLIVWLYVAALMVLENAAVAFKRDRR